MDFTDRRGAIFPCRFYWQELMAGPDFRDSAVGADCGCGVRLCAGLRWTGKEPVGGGQLCLCCAHDPGHNNLSHLCFLPGYYENLILNGTFIIIQPTDYWNAAHKLIAGNVPQFVPQPRFIMVDFHW